MLKWYVSTRDVAVVIEAYLASYIIDVATVAGAPLVRDVKLFDYYEGSPIPAGKVSLGLRLRVGDPGRTLTDEEIEAAVMAVVHRLEHDFGAELRT